MVSEKRSMLPKVPNKRRTIYAISVKFTLIPCIVALLFAGTTANTADNSMQNDPSAPLSRGKMADSADNQSKRPQKFSLFPNGSNFLSPLRFWEKKTSAPPVHTHSYQPVDIPVDNVPVVPRQPAIPPETPPAAKNPPIVPPDVSAMPHPWAIQAAPEPPVNAYSAKTYPVNTYSADTYRRPENMVYGDAPLPMGQPANPAYPSGSEEQTPQKTEAERVSYSSYSFDTRDWVEFFPPQSDTQKNEPVMTQRTSLHSPARNVPQNRSVASDAHLWDSQTTTPIPYTQTAHPVNGTAQQNSVPPGVDTAAAAGQPSMDLSPSYQNRLRHTKACGVVVVQANFPLTEIASILEEINMLQHDLNRYIGVPAPKEKIELCLFKDEASYMNFLKEFFPNAPRDRRALFIKLDNKPGTLLVQKSKDFETDLRHEMTHAVIHASIPEVPIWLDEGLAKYFEVPIQDRAGNNPYMTHVRWNVKIGVVPSLDRLTKLTTIDEMGAKEYQDSWAWTHFLIHSSPKTHQLLASYLQMLSQYSGTEVMYRNDGGRGFGIALGEKIFSVSMTKQTKPVSFIPSLKLYLDDIMPNQKEAFKEHFGSVKK